MKIDEIKKAINNGDLYAADVMENSAYVYFYPDEIHEYAAHYIKEDGVWVWENGIYGDLTEAVGGEEEEGKMLQLLGLADDSPEQFGESMEAEV